jgi:hypothetical protein
LALLGLCNSVISNRALPRSSSIDDIIDEYARLITGGVIATSDQQTVSRLSGSKLKKLGSPSVKRR